MTMVFDRYPAGGNERLLALALADHARDDGTRIWPSIDELSRKTLQSRSTVQRQVAKMVAGGWLERVNEGTGRGNTNEYRISAAWLAGEVLPAAKTAPSENAGAAKEVIHTCDSSCSQGCQSDTLFHGRKGVISDAKGVTTDAKGVTAMTPESSEPSRTVKTPLPPDGGAAGFDAILDAYPNKANRLKAERRWTRLRPDAALQAVMLRSIEAQAKTPKWRKDGGQFVPELATWLRNRCWQDAAGTVPTEWWLDAEGIKAMGERLGLPFTLEALGNAYTDDQVAAHWRSYRRSVIAAAGPGPWAERRAA